MRSARLAKDAKDFLAFPLRYPRLRISGVALMIHEINIQSRIPKAKQGESVATGVVRIATLSLVQPLHRNGRFDLGEAIGETSIAQADAFDPILVFVNRCKVFVT